MQSKDLDLLNRKALGCYALSLVAPPSASEGLGQNLNMYLYRQSYTLYMDTYFPIDLNLTFSQYNCNEVFPYFILITVDIGFH